MFQKVSESTNVDWLIRRLDRKTLWYMRPKEVKKVKDLINHTTNQLGNFPLFYRALLACLSDVISSCYSILLRKFVKT